MENYSDSPEKGEDKTRRYVDLDTGELIETNIKTDGPDDGVGSLCELVDLPHERARTTKTAYPFKWVALFLPAFERIIRADLTKRESHVLLEMLKELQYGNRIDVPHWIIADNLGIDRANVSKAVKKLVEAEIIQKLPDPHDRGRSIYMLNNIVGWRGTSNDWHKTRERGNVIKADFRRNRKEADK